MKKTNSDPNPSSPVASKIACGSLTHVQLDSLKDTEICFVLFK